MIKVGYSNEFLRAFEKLPTALQGVVVEKTVLFQDRSNHRQLRVHKLHGKYGECWSFSINYKFRIVFVYIGKSKSSVSFITVGDHDAYR